MSIDKTLASHTHNTSEIDIYSFHEQYAGCLIIDPAGYVFLFLPLLKNHQIDHVNISREAEKELGVAVAARLKLSKDGMKVVWPQPTNSVLDPQNWSMQCKNLQLFIIMLTSIVPDFDAGIGEQRESEASSVCLMGNQALQPSLCWQNSIIQQLKSSII